MILLPQRAAFYTQTLHSSALDGVSAAMPPFSTHSNERVTSVLCRAIVTRTELMCCQCQAALKNMRHTCFCLCFYFHMFLLLFYCFYSFNRLLFACIICLFVFFSFRHICFHFCMFLFAVICLTISALFCLLNVHSLHPFIYFHCLLLFFVLHALLFIFYLSFLVCFYLCCLLTLFPFQTKIYQ